MGCSLLGTLHYKPLGKVSRIAALSMQSVFAIISLVDSQEENHVPFLVAYEPNSTT